jgi:aspartyl-tRNA(Asn)/glutamyl-tRNA(Gln) amidotransferase subunit A
VPIALGTDTGGSVRQPANFCGVYGLKPTYGAVSRYGLVAYASSLETIGVVAREIPYLEKVFQTIRDQDEKDNTTADWREFPDPRGGEVKKVGVLTGSLGLDPGVAGAYEQVRQELLALGYEVVEMQLPMLDYAVPAYYTIATAEASANLARFNGIRYGHRPVYSENPEELVQKSRDEGFGAEVKLRILLGTYVLRSGFQDQFYLRAQKIRTALVRDFDKVFTQVDAFLLPVFPTQAFSHGDGGLDPFQQKVADKFTTTANLTGLPALAIPTGLSGGLPTGVQFMAPAFCEDRLFGLAHRLKTKMTLGEPPEFPALYAGQEGRS